MNIFDKKNLIIASCFIFFVTLIATVIYCIEKCDEEVIYTEIPMS